MNADTFTIAKLADYAIQQGARHGSLQIEVLAALVIRNRVEAGWHGGDWLEVIEAAPQVAGNDYSSDPYPVNLRMLIIKRLLEQVDEIYHGEAIDPYSGGRALYFADLAEGESLRPWFLDNIVRKPDEHPRIGNVAHITLFA